LELQVTNKVICTVTGLPKIEEPLLLCGGHLGLTGELPRKIELILEVLTTMVHVYPHVQEVTAMAHAVNVLSRSMEPLPRVVATTIKRMTYPEKIYLSLRL
jgi:hypothetical protein